ncbi:MAG: phenylalanine--tRNA ligase subunit beta [Candidatus Pacearchaeota archaeon]|nr:MAG: phenylalanine--tRNA ligase subunit beta [Candidatus Pacearchaeota archaeon]
MAIVTFNRDLFEKEIGKLDENLQNKIAMFGTPIEKIDEKEIHLEIFPNRPDLLSYYNFRRAFLSFLGKAKGLKKYKIKKPESNFEVIIDSSVKDVRPFTACAIVKNLDFDEEKIKDIIELQEKIHFTVGRKRKKVAIGIYPLEKIKLPITFKALEPDKIKFVPLDFDKEMSGLEILQRHPKGREFSELLAGKVKFPIFVDSAGEILSMPPIINSKKTGKITTETKDVFVECSGFDFDLLKSCLNILVSSLAEMGGQIYQMKLKYKKPEITPNFTPKKIKISLKNVNFLLGLNLNEKQIKILVEKMGHDYKKNFVEIAPWRIDILHEVDIIEDIAIAYGYENFVPEIPKIDGFGEEDKKESLKEKISNILVGLGFLEVCSFHLTRQNDQFGKMGIQKKFNDSLKVVSAKTEYSILRENLSHILLRILSENVDAEYPQKIFEIGKIFKIVKEKEGFFIKSERKKILEEESLCIALSPGNYTEIRRVLEYLFNSIDKKIEIKESEKAPNYFIEGRVAEIFFEGKSIGYMGEVHPKILENWKIRMPVAIAEININYVLESLL